MTLTPLRQTLATAVRRSRGVVILGCALALTPAALVAQSGPVFRPPSRVMEGGVIDPSLRAGWRSAQKSKPAEEPPAPEPVELPSEDVDPIEVEPEVVAPLPVGPPVAWEPRPSAEGFYPHRVHSGKWLSSEPVEDRWDGRWPSTHIPNMLGDFFGAGTERLTVTGDELLNAAPDDVLNPADLGMGDETDFLLVGPGSSVLGRPKTSENNSPWPRNRVFLNYNYLSNTSLQDGGVGVHRLAPGFEYAFGNEMFSVDFRLPVGVTFDNDSIVTGGSSRDQMEFGNPYVAMKALLHSSCNFVVSGGLAATFPLADDLRFFNENGRELIRVKNHAVHLMPYLAGAWSDGGWFAQSFLQLDYDLNGNPVSLDDGIGLLSAGDYNDASYLYWDIGIGYWLFKNNHDSTLTGLAPTMEIHYNSAMNTPDGLRNNSGLEFGVNRGQVEVVNWLVGATFEIANCHSLAIGYGSPIGGGDDEQFDYEIRVLLNCSFGGN